MATDKNARSRTWCIVLYPDDLPDDWQQQLQLTGVQTVLSPLHDQDLNADGAPKKPHHHAVLLFTSKKSAQQLREMFSLMYGTTVPDEHGKRSIIGVANISDSCIVHDRRAMVRYLCHLDNPEKAQYSTDELVGMNGADVTDLLTRSMQEIHDILQEIMDFIDYNDIREFYILAKYAKRCSPDWFTVVSSKSTVYLKEFIRSRRHYRAEGSPVKPIINPQTGEVLNADELEGNGGADDE